MAAEQGQNVRQLAALVDRNDSKGTAAASLPIDREVFGVGLDQVGVPGILGDAEVVVALFLQGGTASERAYGGRRGAPCVEAYLLGRLPEDVSWLHVSRVVCLEGGTRGCDALTVL